MTPLLPYLNNNPLISYPLNNMNYHKFSDVILISILNRQGIHSRELPDVALWIRHLEQALLFDIRIVA